MNVNGIAPAAVGSGWVALDVSGCFSPDENVWAVIFLVGGGCDGADGFYDENEKIVYGGSGGDGGYVCKFGKIALKKNTEYAVRVAMPNDRSGTSITIAGRKYTCADSGGQIRRGGRGGLINSAGVAVNPQNGLIGVFTPIGFVGSSGGGGSAVYGARASAFGKGGEGAGSGRIKCPDDAPLKAIKNITSRINAGNYGCGGGGSAFCRGCVKKDVGLRGKGMGGCVIIMYEPFDEKFPNLTVKCWSKTDFDQKYAW